EDRAPLVQVRHDPGAADLREARRARLDLALGLLLKVRQVEGLEDELRQLVELHLGLEVLPAWLVARLLSAPRPLALPLLAADHVAVLRVALALRDVPLLAVVEAELVLVERADRHLHLPLAVRHDDRLVRDDRAEVLLDRVADTLAVALLVDLPLSLEAPVVALYAHLDSREPT